MWHLSAFFSNKESQVTFPCASEVHRDAFRVFESLLAPDLVRIWWLHHAPKARTFEFHNLLPWSAMDHETYFACRCSVGVSLTWDRDRIALKWGELAGPRFQRLDIRSCSNWLLTIPMSPSTAQASKQGACPKHFLEVDKTATIQILYPLFPWLAFSNNSGWCNNRRWLPSISFRCDLSGYKRSLQRVSNQTVGSHQRPVPGPLAVSDIVPRKNYILASTKAHRCFREKKGWSLPISSATFFGREREREREREKERERVKRERESLREREMCAFFSGKLETLVLTNAVRTRVMDLLNIN